MHLLKFCILTLLAVITFSGGILLDTFLRADNPVERIKIIPQQCPRIEIPVCPSLSCPKVECPALVVPECQTLTFDNCIDVVKKARRIR